MSIETLLCPADQAGIARAAALLRQGEIIALPTETVYGIAADARNGSAVKKIFAAKGRPQDNPLIVHIDDVKMLPGLVSEYPERAQLLAAAFWPGPLTIIMSGRPSPTTAQDVWADMQGRLPLILDGGPCDVGVESTVVSVVGEKPTLFRPGRITLEDLERALGEEVELSPAILEKLAEGEVARSPGMKYKHYAPKADITILDGTFEQYKAYLKAHAGQNPACLCFTGEAAELEAMGFACVEYGREGDGAGQAQHIFRCLRALDEQGDRVVYARCPRRDGVSMAVYNRLVRAAAFRVVTL